MRSVGQVVTGGFQVKKDSSWTTSTRNQFGGEKHGEKRCSLSVVPRSAQGSLVHAQRKHEVLLALSINMALSFLFDGMGLIGLAMQLF